MKKGLIIKCGIGVLTCLLVGFLTTTGTGAMEDVWYQSLQKPFFRPPSWSLVPILVFMYISMGIAAGIVWNKGFYHKWVKIALYHFGFQLILNGFWPIVFFGFHAILLALLNSIALFILILLTIKYFKVVSRTAAYLLIPYAIWVLYATVLNFEIWRLNA